MRSSTKSSRATPAVFKHLGLGPSDVVAALDTNSERYIASYYAAAKAGLTFLPLNYRAKDPELEYMINTAKAKVLLVGDRYLDLVGRIRQRLNVNEVVAIGKGDGNMYQLSELARRTDPDETEAEVEEEDVSVLMYTSGTTSLPKGVMLRFRDFVAYVTANVEMADGTDRGVALVCVPFYHIAGTTAMMTNIWTGRKVIVMPQFDPKVVAQAGGRRKSHSRVRRPHHDEAAARRAGIQGRRLFQSHQPRIRRRADADPGDSPRDRGVPEYVGFVNAYGQTETTSSLTVLGPDDHRIEGTAEQKELKLKRLNSIGKPLPDVEIKVRDDDGKFQGASVVGEICIRTPRIMKGYAGREDDSALPDGWRATGDLGWVDEEGYVFFAGRKDDMIIRGGENIAPAEIETVLMSHPAIDEVAVIGVPSVEWGQVVKAFVVKRPGENVSDKELIDFCRKRLSSFKCPESDRVHRRAAEKSTRQNSAQGTAREL